MIFLLFSEWGKAQKADQRRSPEAPEWGNKDGRA